MVKPSIISPEALKKEPTKEDLGKEACLPAFAVIPLSSDLPAKEEEAAGEVVQVPVVNRSRKLGICLCLVMILTLVLIVGLATAMFLGRASGKRYKFFCGVGYDDDYVDYYPSGDPDMLNGKPTGSLDEEVEVRPFDGYEQMEVPAQGYCERLTIIHDFTMNLTAYKLYSSGVCYIGKLDDQTVMAPSAFIERAEEDPAFLSQHYETVSETYRAVLPEIPYVDLRFGLFIPMMCADVPSYLIEKIPVDELAEWEEYWDTEDEEDEDGDGPEYPMDADYHMGRPGRRGPPRHRREAGKEAAFDKVIEFTGKVITNFKILKPGAVLPKKQLPAKM